MNDTVFYPVCVDVKLFTKEYRRHFIEHRYVLFRLLAVFKATHDVDKGCDEPSNGGYTF